jgi:hypothetical protein
LLNSQPEELIFAKDLPQRRQTAGPSTPLGAKNAPNYAQDDSAYIDLSTT